MSLLVSHSVSNDPGIVLDQVQDVQIRQFFQLQLLPNSKCSPINMIENKGKLFYQCLDYYIGLLVKDSNFPEVLQRSQAIRSSENFPNVEAFFGNVRDQFIDDQQFALGLQNLSNSLQINLHFITLSKNQKIGNYFGDPIQLIIYSNQRLQQTIYVLFAKKPKFATPLTRFITPAFPNFPVNKSFQPQQPVPQWNGTQNNVNQDPRNIKNFQQNINQGNNAQINLGQNMAQNQFQGIISQPQIAALQKGTFQNQGNQDQIAQPQGNMLNYQGNAAQQQYQSNFQQNQPQLPTFGQQKQNVGNFQQNAGNFQQWQPQAQVIQPQVNQQGNFQPQSHQKLFQSNFLPKKETPTQEPIIDVLATDVMNKQFQQPTKVQETQPLVQLISQEIVRVENCIVCCENYKLNNEESVLTLCCKKNPHKKCYIQALNEFGANCNDLKKFKCYNCEKQIDLNFLKNNLNKGIYYQIVTLQSMLLTNQDKNIRAYSNQEGEKKVCPKCFKDSHGDDGNCPELQKQILQALEGQPIIFCPFCNQIQTKDDGCDHVKCAGCKNELCSVCSCDRRPILSHGNHFHRVGCSYCQGTTNQLSKDSEYNRKCEQCILNGKCIRPEPLDEYRRCKNY